MKICNDCGKITPLGPRCPRCQQARDRVDNAQRMAKTKASGRNTARWRKLRAAVIERDGHRCQRCGSGHYLTVHLDAAMGGNHWHAEAGDCATLCSSCHGQADGGRARGGGS